MAAEALVSDGHAAAQRRDADHLGRARPRGGAHDRREPAMAEHGDAWTCRCIRGSTRRRDGQGVLRRSRPRRCERSTRAALVRGRASASATLSTAATAVTRSSTWARSLVAGGGRFARGRARHRPQRPDAAGQRDRADGERPPPAQPHRAGRRHACSPPAATTPAFGPRRPQRRGLHRRALESGHRDLDDAGRRTGDPPVPLDGAAAARRARAVLRRRHLRYVRRARLPRQERAGLYAAVPVQGRTARASSRRARQITGAPATADHSHERSRSTPRTPPRSARSRSSAWAPSRTRSTWSSATCRCPSPPETGSLTATAPANAQHRAARRVHAVHHRRQRRALGRQDGDRRRRRSTAPAAAPELGPGRRVGVR